MVLATLAAGAAFLARHRLAVLVLAALSAVLGSMLGHDAGAPLIFGLGLIAYPDPIQPQVDVNDYLRTQTARVGSKTVTWASGTDTSPSEATSRFVLPKVGLASRIYIDVAGGSATAFDLTIGAGASAVAADGQGPYGIIQGIALSVNGGTGWYDVTGFGTYLANGAESADRYPETAPGTVYTTAPADVASTIFDYPVVDGNPRFGLEVPLCLGPSNPLGMILLQNDQTTVELLIRWDTLSNYAALTAGAVATLSLTATVVLEYFDIPPKDAFLAFFLPMLQWAHWWREERQDVTSTGRDANIVSLDNHDTYLRVLHYFVRNSITNTDNVTDLRFVLNRAVTLFDHDDATHLRRQRAAIGKDLPAFIWDFFQTGTLRDAIHADAYTDIRSVLDIDSIAGTSFLKTVSEKLVDLGEPIGGLQAAQTAAG
jgi:hypothetical protein